MGWNAREGMKHESAASTKSSQSITSSSKYQNMSKNNSKSSVSDDVSMYRAQTSSQISLPPLSSLISVDSHKEPTSSQCSNSRFRKTLTNDTVLLPRALSESALPQLSTNGTILRNGRDGSFAAKYNNSVLQRKARYPKTHHTHGLPFNHGSSLTNYAKTSNLSSTNFTNSTNFGRAYTTRTTVNEDIPKRSIPKVPQVSSFSSNKRPLDGNCKLHQDYCGQQTVISNAPKVSGMLPYQNDGSLGLISRNLETMRAEGTCTENQKDTRGLQSNLDHSRDLDTRVLSPNLLESQLKQEGEIASQPNIPSVCLGPNSSPILYSRDVLNSSKRRSLTEDGFNPINPGKTTKRSKAGNRKSKAMDRICQSCNATATPEWRKGPTGPRTLCNACGLLYAKMCRKREQHAVANSNAFAQTEEARSKTLEYLADPRNSQELLESLRADVRFVAAAKTSRSSIHIS